MKFSIIIPVFNTEKYIKDCIDSILRQDFQDFEIIAINDGSSDSSYQILKEMSLNSEKIKLLDIPNSGNGRARNIGLKEASGEYIIFIDSDDFIDNGMLSFYEKIFSKTSCDVIYNTHKRVRQSGEFYQSGNLFLIFDLDKLACFDELNIDNFNRVYGIKDILSLTLQKTLTMLWAGCYKKDFLKQNYIKLMEEKSYEDIIFGMKIFSKNPKIALASKPFYNYRENLSSLSFQSTRDHSRENIALNLLKWVNVSLEMEKIYLDSKMNTLGDEWEIYCKNALVFCINSACTELQKYGYVSSKYYEKDFLREQLVKLSKYVSTRKRLLIKYPMVLGTPKRITRRVQNIFKKN